MTDKNENLEVAVEPKERKKEIKKNTVVNISDDVLINVKSGFHGRLSYRNPVTGETTVWEHQGEIQVMTMRELRAMKGRQIAFFKNQWVIIVGVAEGENCKATVEDICRSLIVTQFYTNYIDPCDFQQVCSWSENEIYEKVSMLSAGAKENLTVALNGYIKSGRLDSIKKVKAFEKVLDCKLRDFD